MQWKLGGSIYDRILGLALWTPRYVCKRDVPWSPGLSVSVFTLSLSCMYGMGHSWRRASLNIFCLPQRLHVRSPSSCPASSRDGRLPWVGFTAHLLVFHLICKQCTLAPACCTPFSPIFSVQAHCAHWCTHDSHDPSAAGGASASASAMTQLTSSSL
jgi:hypothetical protein